MAELSTKTALALVLIVAILSIGMTAILNGPAGRKFLELTGFATSGQVKINLSVSSSSGITVTQAIDFSTGYANTQTNCTMESNLSSGGRPDTDCQGNWANAISSSTKQYIIVQNTGNTQGNLTINASANATTWISANPTDWAQAFYAAINPTADDGCNDAMQTSAWTALTTARANLCVNSSSTAFQYGVGHDKLWVAAKVNVPADATPGEKQVDVGIFFSG
jgi:hypothetical protein